MSIWEKLLYTVALGFMLTAIELFILQTVIWMFDITLPGWVRILISEAKPYVFIANCTLCYLALYTPWRQFESAQDEYEGIKVVYEGHVLSPEYAAYALERKNSYIEPSAHHNLIPHGYGIVTYLFEDEIIESYEGEFDTGEYHGHGKITFKGRQHVGKFERGALQK